MKTLLRWAIGLMVARWLRRRYGANSYRAVKRPSIGR
jgi:hypothetical protein